MTTLDADPAAGPVDTSGPIERDGGDGLDVLERVRQQIAGKTDDQFFVFLSHRKPDTALAQEVKRLLQDLAPNKLVVWCAQADIRKGARWADSIREALHAADLFLLVYSAEEWRWDWCNWEAGLFDKADSRDEPIIVLRSPGLDLPDTLEGYQGIEATEDELRTFLEDFLLGDKYLKIRPSVIPLSTVSRERIAEVSSAIAKLMSVELRSGYIPQQLTVRWEPQEELTGVPPDAIVEADNETRVLFRVRVSDQTTVTWEELTEFHRSRDHVHVDDYSDRWLGQLDRAVAELNERKNPEPLSWRFRGHQRMGLFRPYLYKFERRDGRLASISIMLLAEDSPRKVGGHRYNMLRSCERTHTEIVEQLRDPRTSLAAAGDDPLDDDEWAARQAQLRESVVMVRNEEATIDPFEDTRCQVVFGERYRKDDVGAVLETRVAAVERIAAELSTSRDEFDAAALSRAVDDLEGALAVLWPRIAQAYVQAVDALGLAPPPDDSDDDSDAPAGGSSGDG